MDILTATCDGQVAEKYFSPAHYTLKFEASSSAPPLTGSVFTLELRIRTDVVGAVRRVNDCPFYTLVSILSWVLGSFFAGRGLLCFVSASLLDPLVSHRAVPSHRFSDFGLPHMGNPFCRLPIPRVVPFLSITECVTLDYEHG
jgi:hypothetical protein